MFEDIAAERRRVQPLLAGLREDVARLLGSLEESNRRAVEGLGKADRHWEAGRGHGIWKPTEIRDRALAYENGVMELQIDDGLFLINILHGSNAKAVEAWRRVDPTVTADGGTGIVDPARVQSMVEALEARANGLKVRDTRPTKQKSSMTQIVEYRVVDAANTEELASKVNEALNEGFQPQGGVNAVDTTPLVGPGADGRRFFTFLQVLVRWAEE
jgi:hypothetical protein